MKLSLWGRSLYDRGISSTTEEDDAKHVPLPRKKTSWHRLEDRLEHRKNRIFTAARAWGHSVDDITPYQYNRQVGSTSIPFFDFSVQFSYKNPPYLTHSTPKNRQKTADLRRSPVFISMSEQGLDPSENLIIFTRFYGMNPVVRLFLHAQWLRLCLLRGFECAHDYPEGSVNFA